MASSVKLGPMGTIPIRRKAELLGRSRRSGPFLEALMRKLPKLKPLRPLKPLDRMQNMKTLRPLGKTKWVRAHWRYDYARHQWEWVLGHWAK